MKTRPLDKVFLSYASEQEREVAAVAVSLRARGYAPFFDRASVSGGQSPEAACRAGVEACDLFVFFVSPSSVTRGAYTLTELEWAKQRWDDPVGHVLPILAADTDLSTVDPYLTQLLNIARVPGNFAIGVCDLVDGLLRPRAARGNGFVRFGWPSLRGGAPPRPRREAPLERTIGSSLPPVTPSQSPVRSDASSSRAARYARPLLSFAGVLALGLAFSVRLREPSDEPSPERAMAPATPTAREPETMPRTATAVAPLTPPAPQPETEATPLAARLSAARVAADAPIPESADASPPSVQVSAKRSGSATRRPRARRGSMPEKVVAPPPAPEPAPKNEVRWVSTPPHATPVERRQALARLDEHVAMCREQYPDSTGSKAYYIDLDGDGGVQRLRRDSRSAISEPFAQCIQTSIKLLRFSFEEGRPVTLVVAVTLR